MDLWEKYTVLWKYIREILTQFWPSERIFPDEGMPLLRLLGLPYSVAAGFQEQTKRDQGWSTCSLWSSLEIHSVSLLSYSWIRQSQGYNCFKERHYSFMWEMPWSYCKKSKKDGRYCCSHLWKTQLAVSKTRANQYKFGFKYLLFIEPEIKL